MTLNATLEAFLLCSYWLFLAKKTIFVTKLPSGIFLLHSRIESVTLNNVTGSLCTAKFSSCQFRCRHYILDSYFLFKFPRHAFTESIKQRDSTQNNFLAMDIFIEYNSSQKYEVPKGLTAIYIATARSNTTQPKMTLD